MILYFADRQLNIIGQASTELPQGLVVLDDLKTEDIETGVATFECSIPFEKDTRHLVETFAEVGNYILRNNGQENELYQIIDAEIDNKKQEAYIYAEDDGMDLLNEVVGKYEADKAYPIDHYIKKYAAGSGFVIGINEVPSLTRKLSWDGEATAAERIASVATQFDGCEVSYSFDIDGLVIAKKYINIHAKRGKDIGIQLRMNQDIDRIITSKTIGNLATALKCTGGTPENEENPITLKGYTYDDGDFYVDGAVLKSRKALKKWSRVLWRTDESQKNGGHITKQYSYDTTSQKTLCAHAITELKKLREMEVNYKIEVAMLPDNVKIGDRVNVIDDAGELYLSTRILQLETSIVNQEQKATLGEYLLKGSGISQKVADLAAEFAKNSVSAARALSIANTAKANAEAAQTQADAAVETAEKAQTAATEAKTAAETATQSAEAAQTAADNAQAAVDIVEESVESIEATVTNAQAAADNAHQAAQTATQKAEEAKEAAENAAADASTAKESATTAQTAAESAVEKAETAQGTASEAKTAAENASQIAASAKADADQAEKDIAAFGDNLTTLSQTMEADYTRKTEFTETTASLQSQIRQNAGLLSSTVSMLSVIDETANDAASEAEKAQKRAEEAQNQADQATLDAQAAQEAADQAAQAADDAQAEADTARAAADTAQAVADKAESDLAAAKADLESVQSRADATEEEIAAAQAAVNAAQAVADKAKQDAAAAIKTATEAQQAASTATQSANEAQAAANTAASYAKIAQSVANEAQQSSAAQSTAAVAATAAAEAQRTAANAVTNANNAQAKADEAAQAAIAAKSAADDADAKAAQAAADLATAQQNLANVTSRVDATAEEVAAAQAAVETAKAAADKAKADAVAAQNTADTAKADAATAQAAANTAKTAADNAQKAAKDAQEAADKAQADVAALGVRVTTAETNISQNAEQIAITASKVESFEVCGWNLLKDSAGPFDLGGTVLYKEFLFDIKPGETYTIGADIETISGNISDVTFSLYYSGSASASCGDHMEDGRFVHTFTVPDGSTDSGVWFSIPSAERQFVLRNVKIEKGTKATDWTPAAEDVDNAIVESADQIRQTITEENASIITSCEGIILSALEKYVETSNFDEFKQTTEAALSIMSGEIIANLEKTTTDFTTVNGELQEFITNFSRYIKFASETAITIGSGDSTITLEIDNEKGIIFKKNGEPFGLWDGVDFHTGNIVVEVNQRAQFGNFGFVPRSDGSLMLLKVGG